MMRKSLSTLVLVLLLGVNCGTKVTDTGGASETVAEIKVVNGVVTGVVTQDNKIADDVTVSVFNENYTFWEESHGLTVTPAKRSSLYSAEFRIEIDSSKTINLIIEQGSDRLLFVKGLVGVDTSYIVIDTLKVPGSIVGSIAGVNQNNSDSASAFSVALLGTCYLASADSHGYFEFSAVPEGEYTVVAVPDSVLEGTLNTFTLEWIDGGTIENVNHVSVESGTSETVTVTVK